MIDYPDDSIVVTTQAQLDAVLLARHPSVVLAGTGTFPESLPVLPWWRRSWP